MNGREIRDRFYRRVLRMRLKNFNSFGSHIPILVALGLYLKPKKILELGAGLSSTPVFLNKSCFPDLISFDSIENDREWFDKLVKESAIPEDSGLKFHNGRIADYVKSIVNKKYDLILIDDSYETQDRVNTIRAVMNSPISDSAVILIHDFETREYKEAAAAWPYSYTFLAYLPNVGVLWKDKNLVDKSVLESIYKTVERRKWRVSIYDIGRWVNIFSEKNYKSTL